MLKLAKLPDRTPAKITITVSSDLNQALHRYAAVYRATYGEAESVADLIPFMLDAFLDSDRGFAKARKDAVPQTETEKPVRRSRAPKSGNAEAAPPVVPSIPQTQEE